MNIKEFWDDQANYPVGTALALLALILFIESIRLSNWDLLKFLPTILMLLAFWYITHIKFKFEPSFREK